MSYGIYLVDENGDTIEFDEPINVRGGTYAVGGTTEAWLNVTYNYSEHYYRTMGDKGIRTIYGMSAEDSKPLLISAIAQLGDDISSNYWEPTEGNARRALENLLVLAEMAPRGIWKGD